MGSVLVCNCEACINRDIADTFVFFEVAVIYYAFFIHCGGIVELEIIVQGHLSRQAWIQTRFYLTLRTLLLIMAKLLPFYYLTLSHNPIYLWVFYCYLCHELFRIIL